VIRLLARTKVFCSSDSKKRFTLANVPGLNRLEKRFIGTGKRAVFPCSARC
jgi:hypothetical protein